MMALLKVVLFFFGAGVDTMAYYSWQERDGDLLGWGIKGTMAERALVA